MGGRGKANFFIVGQPKSGTTALYRFLSRLPDVFLTTPKEPFFFCQDLHEESDRCYGRTVFFPLRTVDQYHALYTRARDQKIRGEATTVYLFSHRAIPAIHDYNPGAKLLVILRNPVDFLLSWHREVLLDGYERRCDLVSVLCQGPEAVATVPVPPAPCRSFLDYHRWVRYHEQLARCYQHFPPEQVKVVIYEQLRRDNAATLRDILAWLGLPETAPPHLEEANVFRHGRPRAPARYLFQPRVKALVRRLVPLRWQDPLWHLARRLFWREVAAPLANRAAVRQALQPMLDEIVGRTSELLGQDLYTLWLTDADRSPNSAC